jgi:hypothetical protein
METDSALAESRNGDDRRLKYIIKNSDQGIVHDYYSV